MGALRSMKRKARKAFKSKEGPFPIVVEGRERIEQIIAQSQAEIAGAIERRGGRLNGVALAYRVASGVPKDGDFTLGVDALAYRKPEESDKGIAPVPVEAEEFGETESGDEGDEISGSGTESGD